MNNSLSYANAETPTPHAAWRQLNASARLELANQFVASHAAFSGKTLEVIEAKPDGQVIVHLNKHLPADQRGTLLLDLEEYLKASIDAAIVIWLEPLGDKNSLRVLRGIEVKS